MVFKNHCCTLKCYAQQFHENLAVFSCLYDACSAFFRYILYVTWILLHVGSSWQWFRYVHLAFGFSVIKKYERSYDYFSKHGTIVTCWKRSPILVVCEHYVPRYGKWGTCTLPLPPPPPQVELTTTRTSSVISDRTTLNNSCPATENWLGNLNTAVLSLPPEREKRNEHGEINLIFEDTVEKRTTTSFLNRLEKCFLLFFYFASWISYYFDEEIIADDAESGIGKIFLKCTSKQLLRRSFYFVCNKPSEGAISLKLLLLVKILKKAVSTNHFLFSLFCTIFEYLLAFSQIYCAFDRTCNKWWFCFAMKSWRINVVRKFKKKKKR